MLGRSNHKGAGEQKKKAGKRVTELRAGPQQEGSIRSQQLSHFQCRKGTGTPPSAQKLQQWAPGGAETDPGGATHLARHSAKDCVALSSRLLLSC